jgi:hypothetical protein
MKAKMLVMTAVAVVLAAADLYAGGHGTAGRYYGGGHYTAGSTYKVGTTTYQSGQYYRSGSPKVERSASVRRQFLVSQGYPSAPRGFQVDHIIPLSRGGTDAVYNMQLLTAGAHRAKTSAEVSR